MSQVIDDATAMNEDLGRMRGDARALVAELREIARALQDLEQDAAGGVWDPLHELALDIRSQQERGSADDRLGLQEIRRRR